MTKTEAFMQGIEFGRKAWDNPDHPIPETPENLQRQFNDGFMTAIEMLFSGKTDMDSAIAAKLRKLQPYQPHQTQLRRAA